MLSRQVAPLLHKFCKVSAYLTIASQRGHALTVPIGIMASLNREFIGPHDHRVMLASRSPAEACNPR